MTSGGYTDPALEHAIVDRPGSTAAIISIILGGCIEAELKHATVLSSHPAGLTIMREGGCIEAELKHATVLSSHAADSTVMRDGGCIEAALKHATVPSSHAADSTVMRDGGCMDAALKHAIVLPSQASGFAAKLTVKSRTLNEAISKPPPLRFPWPFYLTGDNHIGPANSNCQTLFRNFL